MYHSSICRPLSIFVLAFLFVIGESRAQEQTVWAKDGNSYYLAKDGSIVNIQLPSSKESMVVSGQQLTPPGSAAPIHIRSFTFSADGKKVLIYTNSKKVWRYDTRGDYWIYDITKASLNQIGRNQPASSLMFAKISPDGTQVAYVSNHNLYLEDLNTFQQRALTTDGTRQLINGTFDWVYEEEFFCRDGFRWSPDSKKIAYWQIDAKETKDYLIIDNTDSIYPKVKPVEYPVAGEPPSPYHIGVINLASNQTVWMNIPTDPVWRSYVPRMEWADNNTELIIQHLNRKQNQSDLMLCDVSSGASRTVYSEKDSAWIDIEASWDQEYANGGWDWLSNGSAFLWPSEKDGWRHLYRISRDGKKEILLTTGKYDIMHIEGIDEKANWVYFMASPDNATQAYLYRAHLDGKGKAERISPSNESGTHSYETGPGAHVAWHSFSNYKTPPVAEWVSLPDHKPLIAKSAVDAAIAASAASTSNIEFFKVKNADGIEMDAWMVKPQPFDPTKKYPVVFYVYTEPWGQNVKDEYGTAENFLYRGDMSQDGYVYISIDNRGTPVPKGSAWRKCIYRKIGLLNISDQAQAAAEILKWPFIDSSRVAVWGWSGGGSATLNLMFQYPDIYKTGIAIAAVANQLTYDNIYQERYMGLPQENLQDFVNGSPIHYVKGLKGNLLYIHGTGDDNVHYNNAEMLINELIKYNKPFQFMSYPNRTHSISEGPGTFGHLTDLYTRYLREHCPPGGR